MQSHARNSSGPKSQWLSVSSVDSMCLPRGEEAIAGGHGRASRELSEAVQGGGGVLPALRRGVARFAFMAVQLSYTPEVLQHMLDPGNTNNQVVAVGIPNALDFAEHRRLLDQIAGDHQGRWAVGEESVSSRYPAKDSSGGGGGGGVATPNSPRAVLLTMHNAFLPSSDFRVLHMDCASCVRYACMTEWPLVQRQ